MRSNLLSLQNIARQQDIVQNRLATGLKVSSAIDNPSSYYTASSLSNRAADLSALLDSMSQAVQTIKTASAGIEAASGVLQQMMAVTEQTLTEAAMIPHQVEIEYDTNVAALIAQGYTEVNASTTATELQALLDTDGAKVVLTEDVSFSGNLSFNGDNIVLNGGGHKLTMLSGGVLNYGANATFENMQIESEYGRDGWYTRGIYSQGADTTVRNVEIVLNDVRIIQVNGKSIKMVPIMRRTSSIVEMICFVFTICYSSIICETLTHSFLNQRYSKYNDKHHNSRCSCVVNLIAHIEHRVDVKGDCHCTIGRTCASIEQGEDFIIHL